MESIFYNLNLYFHITNSEFILTIKIARAKNTTHKIKHLKKDLKIFELIQFYSNSKFIIECNIITVT